MRLKIFAGKSLPGLTRNFALYLFALSCLEANLCLSQAFAAEEPLNQTELQIQDASADERPAGPDEQNLLLNTGPEQKRSASLEIIVKVLHRNNPVQHFTVYPYPVPPPPLKQKIGPLPTSRRGLKSFMLNVGYNARVPVSKPYQTFGWRWYYCYHTALIKLGEHEPSTILGLYQWMDDMLPYLLVEVKKSNAQEKLRQAHFLKACQEYADLHLETENEAARKGLGPVTIPMTFQQKGKVNLVPGTWWIAGTHKVPGLQYYWQVPVTLAKGDRQTIVLDENNALSIAGGW